MKHRVNWLAIIVSGFAFWLFGGLWYDVIFKTAYAAAAPSQAMANATATYPLVVSFVMSFFLAYGVARMLSWREDLHAWRGAFIGCSMGLLVYGTMAWTAYAFLGLGATLGWINVGYVAIGMGIQGLILGAWRPKAG
jgi:hypothetical protein